MLSGVILAVDTIIKGKGVIKQLAKQRFYKRVGRG